MSLIFKEVDRKLIIKCPECGSNTDFVNGVMICRACGNGLIELIQSKNKSETLIDYIEKGIWKRFIVVKEGIPPKQIEMDGFKCP